MASERGQYGQSVPSAPKKSTPLWEIAIGATAFFGAAYLVVRPLIKETNRTIGEIRSRVREIGIKPGMTQAEQDATWDTYYAKRGLKLDARGDLVPMEKR